MKMSTVADGKPAILDEETGEITIVPTRYKTIIDAHFGPTWKTPNNHDTEAEALSTALECKDPSRTQQQFSKEADINVILSKFLTVQDLNAAFPNTPVYQIAKEEFDLQDHMVTSYMVEQAWGELPIAVRNILKDPKVFLDYVEHCMKTGDLEPLRELGLAKAEATETAIPVTPVPESQLAPDNGAKGA